MSIESKVALNIDVMGGTIAGEARGKHSDPIDSPDWVTKPKQGKIEELLKYQVKQEWYKEIAVRENGHFIDSADLDSTILEECVYAVRSGLKSHVGNRVVCFGTDGAASFGQALAEGIPSSVLGDRSLIVAVAQKAAPPRPKGVTVPIHQEGTDAALNLIHAIYLSTRSEMKGRIGILVDGILYPPRGLHKTTTKGSDPFIGGSRYDRIVDAERQEPYYKWHPFEPMRNVDAPAGIEAHIKLLPGIECISLDSQSNYRNIVHMLKGGIEEGTLNGLIIEAPGSGNPRSNSRDLETLHEAIDIANKAGIPLVVGSDPMQPYRPNETAATYVGAAALRRYNMIEVDGLQRSEIKTIMSQAMYIARKVHQLDYQETIQFVRNWFRNYLLFVKSEITVRQYCDAKTKPPSRADLKVSKI